MCCVKCNTIDNEENMPDRQIVTVSHPSLPSSSQHFSSLPSSPLPLNPNLSVVLPVSRWVKRQSLRLNFTFFQSEEILTLRQFFPLYVLQILSPDWNVSTADQQKLRVLLFSRSQNLSLILKAFTKGIYSPEVTLGSPTAAHSLQVLLMVNSL